MKHWSFWASIALALVSGGTYLFGGPSWLVKIPLFVSGLGLIGTALMGVDRSFDSAGRACREKE